MRLRRHDCGMPPRQSTSRREWPIAAGLILLAFVPSIAGMFRISQIAAGASETPDNLRFMQMPLPVILHILGAIVYAIIGAFQFLPGLRARHLRWHRFAGRYLLVPAGLTVAATGLWMTAFYDTPAIDDGAVAFSRYVIGALMLAFIILGVTAIIRRDVVAHGSWMIRAYALAMGAGIQVFTSVPFFLIFGEPDALARLLQMDAGWIINILVAEWVIARRRATKRQRLPAQVAA